MKEEKNSKKKTNKKRGKEEEKRRKKGGNEPREKESSSRRSTFGKQENFRNPLANTEMSTLADTVAPSENGEVFNGFWSISVKIAAP